WRRLSLVLASIFYLMVENRISRAAEEVGGIEQSTRAVAALLTGGEGWTTFCIHPSGYFLTNLASLDAKAPVRLALPAKRNASVPKESTGRVVRQDKLRNVALVKIDDEEIFPYLKVAHDEPRVDTPLTAVSFVRAEGGRTRISRGTLRQVVSGEPPVIEF